MEHDRAVGALEKRGADKIVGVLARGGKALGML